MSEATPRSFVAADGSGYININDEYGVVVARFNHSRERDRFLEAVNAHDRLQAERDAVETALHPLSQLLALATQAARTPLDRAIVREGSRALEAVKEARGDE